MVNLHVLSERFERRHLRASVISWQPMCPNRLNVRGMREVCPHLVPGVDFSTYLIGLGIKLLNSVCLPYEIEASVCVESVFVVLVKLGFFE